MDISVRTVIGQLKNGTNQTQGILKFIISNITQEAATIQETT